MFRMDQSVLCDEVCRVLQDETALKLNYPIEAKALASYAKNHRINVRNVLEVINTLWPPTDCLGGPPREDLDYDKFIEDHPARFTVRDRTDWTPDEKASYFGDRAGDRVHGRDLEANLVVYDVTFPDGSMGIVFVENGIGVEYCVV